MARGDTKPVPRARRLPVRTPCPSRALAACVASLAIAVLQLPQRAGAQTADLPTSAAFQPGERRVWRQVDDLTHLEQFRFGRENALAPHANQSLASWMDHGKLAHGAPTTAS